MVIRIFIWILSISLFLLTAQSGLEMKSVYGASEEFKQLKSTHFIINYQDGVERSYAREIKRKSEDFYKRITQEFHLVRNKLWLWDNRAKIFIAKDQKNYLKNFDCPKWSAACVNYRTKMIYTYPNQKNFISILAHELTHIIFREYLDRQNLPLWLDEGVAMYIERKYTDLAYQGLNQRMQNKIENGNFIDFKELMSLDAQELQSKSNNYVNLFYLQSFSIINFLIERYRKHNFSRFLWNLKNENNIEKALSKTYYQLKNRDEFAKKWKKFYLD